MSHACHPYNMYNPHYPYYSCNGYYPHNAYSRYPGDHDCLYCGMRFDTKQSKKNHINQTFKINQNGSNQKPTITYTDKIHKPLVCLFPKIIYKTSVDTPNYDVSGTNRYQYGPCGIVFSSQSALDTHVRLKHGKCLYKQEEIQEKCKRCNGQFTIGFKKNNWIFHCRSCNKSSEKVQMRQKVFKYFRSQSELDSLYPSIYQTI